MLILTRRVGEALRIADELVITVVETNGNEIRDVTVLARSWSRPTASHSPGNQTPPAPDHLIHRVPGQIEVEQDRDIYLRTGGPWCRWRDLLGATDSAISNTPLHTRSKYSRPCPSFEGSVPCG
jgi:hypothetical protein